MHGIPGFRRGGQGGRVGGEALQQLAAQRRGLAAEGIEGIGAGGAVGEALQQLAPEALGGVALSAGLRRQRRLFERHRCQGTATPALPL